MLQFICIYWNYSFFVLFLEIAIYTFNFFLIKIMLFKINFQMIMLTSVTKMLWGKGVGQYVWFFFLKKNCLLASCLCFYILPCTSSPPQIKCIPHRIESLDSCFLCQRQNQLWYSLGIKEVSSLIVRASQICKYVLRADSMELLLL